LASNPGSQLTLLHPVERGEIKDYDSMQKILDHIFKHELRVNPKDHPVMLTVSPLCSPESRMELAKLMFDVFAVPALCMANQAVLSLYSTGRTTGVVLELGEGMSYCVPVYEGFALRHAVLSIPIAGADVTKFLMRNLGERGVGFADSQADTVRDIKERLCRVKQNKFDYNVVPITASNAATAVAQASSSTHTSSTASSDLDETSYELPSGQMIRLDDHTRFNTLEILFSPSTYAQAMNLNYLTGGSNQGYGIPPQASGPGSGGGSGSQQQGQSSSQALSSPSAGGGGPPSSPPTPNNAGGGGSGSGSGSNPPGTASSSGGFGSRGGEGRGGLFGSGGGPISIDLSTNDLLGVHTLIAHSVGMCDAFLRKDLLKNIVLAGGTSMAKGFGDRMKRELHALLAPPPPPQQQLQGSEDGADVTAAAGNNESSSSSSGSTLNVITDSQRKYAAWIGASMYASLPTFGIIKITSEQYKRDESIVHKKFF
jgi:actin-related protein